MYSKMGVWSRFGPFDDTIPGRDAFIQAFRDRLVLAEWIPRPLPSYFDISTNPSVPIQSANVFMNCGTNNESNWGIFDYKTNLRIFVIDQYDPDPPTKMGCILPGAVKGGFTSLGYVETVTTDPNAVFNGVRQALSILGYQTFVTGSRRARAESGGVLNGTTQVLFGTETGTFSQEEGYFRNGGYVLRCQPSIKTVFKGGVAKTYGLSNDLEIALLQPHGSMAGSAILRAATSKRFAQYPNDQAVAPSGTIEGDLDSTMVYRSQYTGTGTTYIKTTSPWVLYANPHMVFSYHDAPDASSIHARIDAGALKLLPIRLLDTQDIGFDELTFCALTTHNLQGFDRQGWMGPRMRTAVKTNYGYNKVRYHASSALAQQGQLQLYSDLPGRSSAALAAIVDGPWFERWREGGESWCGWGMTGEGPSDLTIVGGALWDGFVLHEDTFDPVNSVIFQHDGQYFKKWTKRASSGNNQDPFTLALRVTVVV